MTGSPVSILGQTRTVDTSDLCAQTAPAKTWQKSSTQSTFSRPSIGCEGFLSERNGTPQKQFFPGALNGRCGETAAALKNRILGETVRLANMSWRRMGPASHGVWGLSSIIA